MVATITPSTQLQTETCITSYPHATTNHRASLDQPSILCGALGIQRTFSVHRSADHLPTNPPTMAETRLKMMCYLTQTLLAEVDQTLSAFQGIFNLQADRANELIAKKNSFIYKRFITNFLRERFGDHRLLRKLAYSLRLPLLPFALTAPLPKSPLYLPDLAIYRAESFRSNEYTERRRNIWHDHRKGYTMSSVDCEFLGYVQLTNLLKSTKSLSDACNDFLEILSKLGKRQVHTISDADEGRIHQLLVSVNQHIFNLQYDTHHGYLCYLVREFIKDNKLHNKSSNFTFDLSKAYMLVKQLRALKSNVCAQYQPSSSSDEELLQATRMVFQTLTNNSHDHSFNHALNLRNQYLAFVDQFGSQDLKAIVAQEDQGWLASLSPRHLLQMIPDAQAANAVTVPTTSPHAALLLAKAKQAIEVGDLSSLSKLIREHGLDPASVDDTGNTLLHHAARTASPGGSLATKWLACIQPNMPLDAVNHAGHTALQEAFKAGHIHAVHTLLNTNANFRVLDQEGNTCLHLAALHTDADFMRDISNQHSKLLLDCFTENRAGLTPAVLAIQADLLENARALFELNNGQLDWDKPVQGFADETTMPRWRSMKNSPFHKHMLKLSYDFCYQNNISMYNDCLKLIDREIEHFLKDMKGFIRKIMATHDTQLFKKVIASGAFFCGKQPNGYPRFHEIVMYGSLETVRAYVNEHGPDLTSRLGYGIISEIGLKDPSVYNIYGWKLNCTPLMSAAFRDRLDIVKYLIEECGANPHDHHKGIGLLHIAAARGSERLIDYCLDDLKLDIEQKAENNVTPYLIAATTADLENMALLAKRGANTAAKDVWGFDAQFMLRIARSDVSARDQYGYASEPGYKPDGYNAAMDPNIYGSTAWIQNLPPMEQLLYAL